jgi:hypothetical protein
VQNSDQEIPDDTQIVVEVSVIARKLRKGGELIENFINMGH